MCGRFNVIDNPELQTLLRVLGIDMGLPSRSNIAPTENILMVREPAEAVELRWWLTPRWARQVDQKYSMFNARSETLASSRAFAEPFRRRRGIVPVSSFIEWRAEEGGRQPYLIQAEGSALALAAVWDRWEGVDKVIESCALVTTAAAPEFEQIHKRMPVMLAAEDCQRWLDCSTQIAANDGLFEPRLQQRLRIEKISREVNNARNKAIELIYPIDSAFSVDPL
jgi:putative SOS response-associated peptidase YedK